MTQRNGTEITKAGREDLPVLAETLFASKIGRKYYPTLETLLTLMERSFDDDQFYILYDHTEMAGFIWFQTKGAFHTFTYLHMIYVKKEYRQKGYGKTLLEFLEKAALCPEGKNKLQSKIFLVVGEWNQSAIQFYTNEGYITLSTIPGLFRKKIDEHLMMKECFRA